MRVIRYPSELENKPRSSAITIGNFDGVHLGHQRLLDNVVERARSSDSVAVVLTFDPHPTQVLAPERTPKMLTSLEEKARLMEAAGIELICVLPFTRELSLLGPEDFVNQILIDQLAARVVVVGPNFRFGHRHAGDVRLLEELGRRRGFDVEVAEGVTERGQMVSSTRIRELAEEGRVSLAGRLLGRPFSVSGPIVSGLGIGKSQTVPTLNLAHVDQRSNGRPPRQLPRAGVYVTRTLVAGREHVSVTNVGRKPTFGEHELTVESYLLDYSDGPLDADSMTIQFLHRLRDERKFADAAALKAQILRDVQRSLAFFRRCARFQKAPGGGIEGKIW